MASKAGCNKDYTAKLSSQGKGRMAPAQFARNNMAKGGVNARIAPTNQTSAGTAKRK